MWNSTPLSMMQRHWRDELQFRVPAGFLGVSGVFVGTECLKFVVKMASALQVCQGGAAAADGGGAEGSEPREVAVKVEFCAKIRSAVQVCQGGAAAADGGGAEGG
jgi:hypothetical protein